MTFFCRFQNEIEYFSCLWVDDGVLRHRRRRDLLLQQRVRQLHGARCRHVGVQHEGACSRRGVAVEHRRLRQRREPVEAVDGRLRGEATQTASGGRNARSHLGK